MTGAKEKLIVAIDTDSYENAVKLIDSLDDSVDIYKIGLENYLASRGKTVDYLKSKGKKIFLDLKFHDIPNTMKSAVKAIIKDGVWMITIHISDRESMKQCVQIAREEAEKLNIKRPLIIGVSVLTSLSNEDLLDVGCKLTTGEAAIKRAKLAKEAGLDGVVCSAQEVDKIIKACGEDFITVCPGIRPANVDRGDQKRVLTPSEAIKAGASKIVVGRAITKAENPASMAEKIIKEIEIASSKLAR